MQTDIHPSLIARTDVQDADEILRKCVHCGFCTATCPSYQLLGDELDGPRGRIYLIKNMLEQGEISSEAGAHLDRCLTCRSCETTCPSGVEYGHLLDIGRGLKREMQADDGLRSMVSALIRLVLPRRYLFAPLVTLGRAFRVLLPAALKEHILPAAPRIEGPPEPERPDMLLLGGCVQSVMTPQVNESVRHLLAKQGVAVKLVEIDCCGALDYHLSHHDSGRDYMRRVMDRLENEQSLPVISSATGCGVTLKEYDAALAHTDDATRAQGFARRVQDVSEVFAAIPEFAFRCRPLRVAVHTPCSMQHGMKLNGVIEEILSRAGFDIVAAPEGHLCCGSAGTYSIMQPQLSHQLRENKLVALGAGKPDVIVTGNIGCQMHLGAEAYVPVMHWAELMYRQLEDRPV